MIHSQSCLQFWPGTFEYIACGRRCQTPAINQTAGKPFFDWHCERRQHQQAATKQPSVHQHPKSEPVMLHGALTSCSMQGMMMSQNRDVQARARAALPIEGPSICCRNGTRLRVTCRDALQIAQNWSSGPTAAGTVAPSGRGCWQHRTAHQSSLGLVRARRTPSPCGMGWGPAHTGWLTHSMCLPPMHA